MNITDMFADYPDVVTVKELQQMLRLSRTQTYALIHSGDIDHFKLGTSIRIPKKAVTAFLHDRLDCCQAN